MIYLYAVIEQDVVITCRRFISYLFSHKLLITLPSGVPYPEHVRGHTRPLEGDVKLPVLVIHEGHHTGSLGGDLEGLGAPAISEGRLHGGVLEKVVQIFSYHNEAHSFNTDSALVHYWAA